MDIRERIANAKSPEGDFMPQFEQAAEQLLKLCKAVREMNFYVDSEGSVTEVEGSIQLPVTGDWHGK